MQKALMTFGLVFLGLVFGCLTSLFWYSGANTFWKRIDYFPFPVSRILALKPYGTEFWVETSQSETYSITYPCTKEQKCWQRSDAVPAISSGLTDGAYTDFTIQNGACKNDNFVYPLLHKVKMCATSIASGGESFWTVSLALADDHTLWIWNKPWDSPYTEMQNVVVWMVIAAILGLMAGIFLSGKVHTSR